MDYNNAINGYRKTKSIRYCSQCGTPVSADDKFCGKCGEKLNHDNTEAKSNNTQTQSYRSGIIYTDTQALATKFGVHRGTILALLNSYIENVSSYIDYRLLDVCEHLQRETVMPLSTMYGEKDWKAYHSILYKNYIFSQHELTEYLFIIGGEDIIPMPEIPSVFTIPDKIIPTDYLYAYSNVIPKGTIEIVNSISSQNICYHVGRLPLGTDATLDMLDDYLTRAGKMLGKGIPVQMTYAQSDPTWKRVSSKTISDISDNGLIPDVNVDASLCYENIFLSPFITVDTIDNVFNPYANLFYFNLHGSNDPQNPSFSGYDSNGENRQLYRGISPKSFQTTKFDNIVVTEACYGGKFRGLKTSQSMLLTALANSTLLYVGSSVVAIGSVDPNNDNANVYMCCADVLAKEFIRNLMGGRTAGEALTHTRYKLYNAKNLTNLLTILEFSLFGDPAMTAKFPKDIQESVEKVVVPKTLAAKGNFDKIYIENLYDNEPNSFLSFVRKKVDDRFNQVHSDIQDYLSTFGVKPRKLASVRRIRRGTDTQVLYTFNSDTYSTIIVSVDSNNNKQAMFSKERSVSERLNAGSRVSINYPAIFRRMCKRFGLISPSSVKMGDALYIYSPSAWCNNYDIQDLMIDNRVEDISKLQVETFNTMLDEAYRKRMSNRQIPNISIKSEQHIDFAALMNPLCLILENELRLSIWEYLRSIKLLPKINGKIRECTLGTMIFAMEKHPNVMERGGLSRSFSKKFNKELSEHRNSASHRGDISEEYFINFYNKFASIVNDEGFGKLMDMKYKYKPNKE